MKAIAPFLMALAAIGFLLSAAAHLMAIAGIPIPGGKTVMTLHIGVFVVWLPTVIACQSIAKHGNRKDLWKIVLSCCPVWMQRALMGLFGYAILNFVFFFIFSMNHPKTNGTGHDTPSPTVVRGFSGHWMIFYGVALAVLYSQSKAPHLFSPRKCSQGHDITASDRFCPQCGQDLGNFS